MQVGLTVTDTLMEIDAIPCSMTYCPHVCFLAFFGLLYRQELELDGSTLYTLTWMGTSL